MAFKYTHAISKIRKMKARIKVIPGGSSAGKTIAILSILIDKALKNPNLSISVVSESTPHLRRGAIRDAIGILKDTKRFNRQQWHTTNSTYRFLNGSYIEFFSADQGDKLRGARRDVLYINEANMITREAYLELAMRTNEDIYLDYNPTHSFWSKEVLQDDNSELLTLTYKDNSALPQNVIDFLESKRELAKTSEYWTNWCKVYLDGEEGKLQGTIFNDYEVIDKIPDEARLLGCGLDFGYSVDPSTLIAIYKWNDEIIADEIFYESGLLNGPIASKIKESGLDRIGIYADSAEPKSIAEIKRYGVKINPVTKGADSINFGIQLLQEQKLRITKRSRNLLDELSKYIWKVDREGNNTNTPSGGNDHAIDSLRYAAMMLLKKKTTEGRLPYKIHHF
jgi:phage terminase large subunit